MSEEILGKARKDYTADAGNELSVKKGDILELINFSDDSDWWKGKFNGQEGYLPKEIIELEKCEVVVDYFDVEEGQLRLSVGDRIEILQKERNKWFGRNSNGEEGYFSPSFVKRIPLTAPPMPPVSDPYGTLNSIKPNEVLYDVRKDRPRKITKQTTQNILPERKTFYKEPEVKITSVAVEESREDVILRPKPFQKQAQPFLTELSEKTKLGDFSNRKSATETKPINVPTRKIIKSGNFDDIKNMWNSGITKEPVQKKTEIVSTRHILHRKSVSNVRDQFENNRSPINSPNKNYENRMFEIKSTSISNVPIGKIDDVSKKTPIITTETIKIMERTPSFDSRSRTTEYTTSKILDTNLSKSKYSGDGPTITEIKDEPEIKLSEIKSYPRGILRNKQPEQNILEPKSQYYQNEPSQIEIKTYPSIYMEPKTTEITITKTLGVKKDPLIVQPTNNQTPRYFNGEKKQSSPIIIESTHISNETPSLYNKVYSSTNGKYAKSTDNKPTEKNGINSDQRFELDKRVKFLEIKVLELEKIITELRNKN